MSVRRPPEVSEDSALVRAQSPAMTRADVPSPLRAAEGPEVPEPDELAPVPADRDRLRMGFTTGTAATAAAMAATIILSGRPAPRRVTVRLPGGEDLEVAILKSSSTGADEALAVVVKDAGDDPDVTNQAEIGAIVRRRSEPGLISIIGGAGVGRLTKPGLALAPGEWAINPGPRAMLRENLLPFLGQSGLPGLELEIFVKNGETLAAETLNPRLGIVGGISILGTTGLVKPFSNEAYLATISNAQDLARALGLEELVLTTGRQSEKLAMSARPDLPEEAFVQVADFYGDSLQIAAEHGFKTIGLAAFFGKAVKQAAGHRNTHAHRNDQDPAALAEWMRPSIGDELAEELREAMTARASLEILRRADRLDLVAEVAERALTVARTFSGPGPGLWMMIFDYDGRLLCRI